MFEEIEIWKDIPGLPGYQVSSLGNVRSFKKRGTRNSWFTSNKPTRILKPYTKCRYRKVHLSNDGQTMVRRVSSLVMLAFVGERSENEIIRHLNGIYHDDRLANLAYGSQKQNVADMMQHMKDYPSRYRKPITLLPPKNLHRIKVRVCSTCACFQLYDDWAECARPNGPQWNINENLFDLEVCDRWRRCLN